MVNSACWYAHRSDDTREALSPVGATAREYTYAVLILADHEAVPVKLYLVNPIRPARSRLCDCRDTRFNKTNSGTHRCPRRTPTHGPNIDPRRRNSSQSRWLGRDGAHLLKTGDRIPKYLQRNSRSVSAGITNRTTGKKPPNCWPTARAAYIKGPACMDERRRVP